MAAVFENANSIRKFRFLIKAYLYKAFQLCVDMYKGKALCEMIFDVNTLREKTFALLSQILTFGQI